MRELKLKMLLILELLIKKFDDLALERVGAKRGVGESTQSNIYIW